jgi:type VI secretion system secreted protein VgrG
MNHFEVVAACTAFRPARRAPEPYMRGPQTAVMIGPRDSPIHPDVHGLLS